MTPIESSQVKTRTSALQEVAVGIEGAPIVPVTAARRVWVESFVLLFRYKILILSVTAVVIAGTAVYLFGYAQNWFKATTVILPARRSSNGALDNLTSSISSTIKDLGLSKLSGGGDASNYSPLSLISSREVQESLVQKYDLVKVYQAKDIHEAQQEFAKHVLGEIDEQGYFTISFEDTDPKRAALIANDVVAALNKKNSDLAVEEAKFNKQYIEERYAKLLVDLDSAEHALAAFQRKYGVFSLPDQAKAELAALGGLEQQRYAMEIQLHNAEQVYGNQSPEATMLRSTLNELNDKLAQSKTGFDSKVSYLLPTNVLPDVAMDYLRLMREVEIQSKLKAFLLPGYEQAKIDENRETLAFIVLDHAIPPQTKARPKRTMMLLVAALSSIFLCSMLILLMARFNLIRASFRHDRHTLGI